MLWLFKAEIRRQIFFLRMDNDKNSSCTWMSIFEWAADVRDEKSTEAAADLCFNCLSLQRGRFKFTQEVPQSCCSGGGGVARMATVTYGGLMNLKVNPGITTLRRSTAALTWVCVRAAHAHTRRHGHPNTLQTHKIQKQDARSSPFDHVLHNHMAHAHTY